jgi:hypothetical protein
MRISVVACLVLTSVAAPAASQSVPSSSHEAAALELLSVMKLEEVSISAMTTMIDQMVGQTPELAAVQDVIEGFFKEYMSWNALQPEYARIYVDAFSESEMRELIAFYRTPIGQKVAETNPRLIAEGAAAGEKLIQPHIAELQTRIMTRMREMN